MQLTIRELNVALMHTPLTQPELRQEIEKTINALLKNKQSAVDVVDIPWTKTVKSMSLVYTELKRTQRR